MPLIQLISQRDEFKKTFKEKFKSAYNIFTAGSIKDGIRNIQKMDIDLLIIEANQNRFKSLTWIDSLLRLKNVDIGEMSIIFLMDIELTSNPGFKKLSSIKKNFHFFWYNTSAFELNPDIYSAFEIFLDNKMLELHTLRMNYILSNRLSASGQSLPVNSESTTKEIPISFSNQPLSFLPNTNTNTTFLDTFDKAANTWPVTLFRGIEGLEQDNLAKYIHFKKNSVNQFISLDLSEIPEYYHNSVLFGIKQKNLPGFRYINSSLFEMVKKGTVYLKNIEYLNWDTQNELLQLLQNLYYWREDLKIPVKCRFIFSSTVDLEKYVEKGIFRQNLYSHLAVYTLNIPTVQQRKKDIPLLIDDYIRWFEKKYGKTVVLIEETRMLIAKNAYSGQFEQFYNYLFKIFSLSAGTVTPSILSMIELDERKSANQKPIKKESNESPPIDQNMFIRENIPDTHQFLFTELEDVKNLDYSLTDIEREYIKHILVQNFNNIAESARVLGVTRKTLYGKLKKYNIQFPVKKTG